MSAMTKRLKEEAKRRRFDAIVTMANLVRGDDGSDDGKRRAAAHAHVMTHHALEMETPEAHKAAAAAHQQVADMHLEEAEDLSDDEDDDEAPDSSQRPNAVNTRPAGTVKQQGKTTPAGTRRPAPGK